MKPDTTSSPACIRRLGQALTAVLLICALPLSASAQPQWINARAASGDSTMLFWFDQDVADSTATNTSYITLSGGLTIDSIRVQGHWTTVDSMPTPRDEAASVVIDGKIYVQGGNGDSYALEVYDPNTGNWQSRSTPTHNRNGAVAVQMEGKMYLVGGGGPIECYDPRTDSWTDLGYGDQFSWGAGGLINGKLYYAAQYTLREYDLATGTERIVSGMPSGRWYAAYGVIEGKLYVAGGESEGNGWASNQLEIYDPATDSWSNGAAMPVNLTHAAGAVLDGRLYVVGGYFPPFVNSDQVYAYDPGSNTWSTEGTLPFARHGSSAVTLRGKLHVMGGNNGSYLGRNDIWNPQTGYQASLSSGQKFLSDTDITITASNIKDLGGTPNPTPLQQTFTPQSWDPPTLIVDARAGTHSRNIVFPFRITDTDGNPVTLTCEYSTDGGSSWNVATTSGTITDLLPAEYQESFIWQSGSDFPGQSVGEVFFRITPSDQPIENGAPHTSIIAIDNQPPSTISASGLSGYDTVTFRFDEPVVDTTATNPGNISLSGLTVDNITVQNWQNGQQLPALKSGSASAQINGNLYVVGGDAGGNELHVFDPTTNTWSLLTANNGWRDGGAAAVLNSKLYLIGNWSVMEYYDPGTDSWTWVAGDYGADQSWAAFEEIGGFLYIAAGDREDNTARRYSPATNNWTDFAAFPTPRRGVVSAVIDGKMYVAGGETGGQTTFYSTLEVYDPATDSWSTKASMPKALAYAAGDVLWGKFVIAGGFDGTNFNSDVYVYDPATDSWSTESTIPNLRWKTTASTIANKLYIASGYHEGYIQALDIYDMRGEYTATLSSGEVLPAAETSVMITASNITDRYGNIQGTPIQTSFNPETGQTPSVDVEWPVGTRSGDLTLSYQITDDEGNPVALDIEYSTDNGGNWQPATTTGTITGLYPADYSGSFTWQSATDLSDQEVNNLRLRITPSDNATTPGQVDVLIIDIDNRAPLWIEAQGVSGDISFTFWFNEPVPESTATAVSNYSLSGSFGISAISVNETWDRSHTLGITPVGNAAVTELDGKLYVVGGHDGTNYYDRLEVFDPVTGDWTALASLPSPRAYSVVAGLSGKLYALSGDNAGGRLNVFDVYDPATNSWSSLSSPPITPAYWDATARGIGGKLYVNQRGEPPEMYIYDPDTDSWTNMTGGLNVDSPATAVIDGKYYIAGGQYDNGNRTNELVVFDPATGVTTALASMFTPRHRAVGGAIDGKFHVVGGVNNSGDLATLEMYDPVTDTWTTGPDMPVQRSDYMGDAVGSQLFHGRAINYQGTDHLVFDMLDRGVYDLTLSSGQKLPPPPNSITMTASNINDLVNNTITGSIETTFTPSSGQAPVVAIYGPAGIRGGDIPIQHVITDAESNPVWLMMEYQLAGESTWNPTSVQGDTADIPPAEYTGTLTWQSATDLPDQIANRVRLRIVPRDNETTWGTADTILVNVDNQAPQLISAEGTSGDNSITFWFDEPVQEDTATNTNNFSLSGSLTVDSISPVELWESLAITAPTRRWNVGVGVMDNKLYVVGGQDEAAFFTTVEVYDPETDTWSSLPDMPTPRRDAHVHEINGKLYVIGGHDQVSWVDILEVYDPETNSWESRATEGQGAWWDRQGAVINGKLYLNTGNDPAEIHVYDPHTDSWEYIPGGLSHGNVAAAAIDGKLYLAGGWHHSGQYNASDLVVFDPADNSTTWLAWMPTARSTGVGAVIDGRFYVINGNDDSGSLNRTEIYDPATNLWSTGLSNTHSGTWTTAGAVIGGKLYQAIWGEGDGWTDNYTAFDIYSRDQYRLQLSSGQTIPSPPDSVTITASNITDWQGNTTAVGLDTTFTPLTGGVPTVAVFAPAGIQGGGIPIQHIITDAEGNPVWLMMEYQLAGESTWNPAAVQGDTTDIPPAGYTGTLTWQSKSDLPDQIVDRVRLRVTPRDNETTWGTADTLVINLDNQAPSQIIVDGPSGSSTLAFWFDEPVQEDTATNTDNFSLSGNLTVDGINPVELWESLAITAPTKRTYTGVGVMDGKLYVVGGMDEAGFSTTVEVYDPESDTWSSLPDMPTPRHSPHVHAINGKLYVISGHDQNGWVDANEVYDPETNSWMSLSAINLGSTWDSNGAVINGKLYLNTGGNPPWITVYDPHTDSWELISGGLPHGGVAAGAINGKLYLAGGWHHNDQYNASDLVVFDPADNSTTGLAWMPTSRQNAIGAIIDGRFYVVNGNDDSGNLSLTQIYNPETNLWTMGSANIRSGTWAMGGVIDGELYFPFWDGDWTDNHTAFDIYSRGSYEVSLASGQTIPAPPDSVTITASNITDWQGNTILSSLKKTFTPSTGQPPAIALYPSHEIPGGDVTIGYIISDGESNPVSLLAEYQLQGEATWQAATMQGNTSEIPSDQYNGSLVWNSATDFPDQTVYRVFFRITPRDNPSTTGTADETVFTLDNLAPASFTAQGASGDNKITLRFNEAVKAETATGSGNYTLSGGLTVGSVRTIDNWESLVTTAPTKRWEASVGVMDNKLYLVGGMDEASHYATVEVYDPETDIWTTLPDMPTPRQSPHVFAIGGKLYVIGGHDQTGWIGSMDIFDPNTESWTNRPTDGHGSWWNRNGVVINGKIYMNIGDDQEQIAIYDPHADTWTYGVWGGVANSHVSVGTIDGKFYIAGGWNDAGQYYDNGLRVFDPATGNSEWKAGMSYSRMAATGAVIDGKFIVVGGQDQNGDVNVTEIYDPQTNTWTTGQPPPHGGSWTSVGGVINGKLYRPLWDGNWTDYYTAFDVYSRDTFEMELGSGETIPAPPDTVIVAAFNQVDLAGNSLATTGTTLVTTLHPITGGAPSVAVYPQAGIRSGDVSIGYRIHDTENNLVSLQAEYSLPGESTWNTASISGTIIDIPSDQYEGSLLWQSRSDLADQVLNRVRFRLTPYDNESTDGTPGTVIVNIDNQAPATISADGASGDSTITFWFDEPVTESSATNTGNIALSGGLSVNSIQVNEVWATAQISLSENQVDPGIGVLDGKLYAVGGWDGNNNISDVMVYDPVLDTWSQVSNMSIPRQRSIVTAYNGLLYVMGGEDEFNWLGNVEAYDPETNSWSSRNDANWGGPNWKYKAAAIDGRIYVYGDGSIHIYDPDTDSWEWISGGIESPNDGAAIGVIDGKLYIAGGYNYNEDWYRSELQVFDPETRISTSLTGMPNARHNASGAVIDGKFYVIGGQEFGNRYYETLVYDPGTDIWTYNSPPPSETGITGIVLEGRIYIDRWEQNHWAFDVYSRDTFTIQLDSGQTLPPPPNSVTITASNITDHYGNTASDLTVDHTPSTGQLPSIVAYQPTGTQNGDITIPYVISDQESNPVWLLAEYQVPGTSSWLPATVTGDTTEINSSGYNGALVWNSGTDLPETRHRQVRFRLTPQDNTTSWGTPYITLIDLDNRAPVWVSARASVGESTIRVRFNEPVSEATATDAGNYSLSGGLTAPNVNAIETWDFLATTAPTRREYAGVSTLDGKVYVVGGWFESSFYSTAEEYDPATDSWTQLPDMPTPRRSPFVFVIDGLLYAIGGTDFTGDLDVIEVYDPELNSWTSRTAAAQGTPWTRNGVVINGKIYLNTGRDPAEIAVYDPHTNSCEYIPGGLPHEGVAAGAINGKLYLTGGWHGSGQYYASDLVVFDPTDNSTTWKTNMPTARGYATGAVLDGKFYVINGDDASGTAAVTEIYDPETDMWSTSGLTYIHGGSTGVSVVINGELYQAVWDDNYTDYYTAFDVYERNTYELTLGAGETLPFEQITLQVTGIKDWYGNAAGTLLVDFVPEDANANPTIELAAITDEVSGDIALNYLISDAEGDAIRLIPEFSIDQEASWQRATTGPDTINIASSVYDGTLTWFSATDLPGQDIQDVRFRLTPADNDVEIGEADVISLHVDNNEEPSVTITATTYSSTDTTWTIEYQLSDAESDTLSINPRYSTDGGMTWPGANTTGTISGIGPDSYTGSIIWNIERDLPGAVQDVLFTIDPVDNDGGQSDEVALRLNVYGVPAVDISTEISTEQDGDILFAYTITDEEGDPVSLLAEYFIPGDAWYPATVTDDRASDSVYDGNITWHTRTDLDGADIEDISFRLTPTDANAGFTDEVSFHLDNNYAPEVTDLSSLTDRILRNHSFTYTLSDVEGDVLDLRCLYSNDGGNSWFDMTTTGTTSNIDSGSYNNSFTWEAFDDLGYGEFTGVMLKIIPGDLDWGAASDTVTTTVVNYVGDYSADGSVSSADFATLVSAYNTQNTYHDIGPATGSVPWLMPVFDGVIDFEDLAVFIQMWNWSLGITTQAEAAGLLTRPTEKVSGSSAAEHPVQLEERLPDDLWAPDSGVLEIDLRANRLPASMVVSIEIDYDAEHLEFLNLEPGPFMGKAGGEGQTLLSLKNVDTERGRLSLLLGRIDREDPEVSGNGLLAGLQFKKLSKENSDIRVAYELWNRSAEMTTQAVYETEVQALRIPNNFELLQNYPNPFNGETIIRFQLPTEQRVQLYVYNIRGQRVATIIDERMDAGYHRVTWTGRNDDGRQVGSGVYIYLIQAGPHRQSKKLTYIK